MDILPQLLVNSMVAGAIYAIVALGFNLLYRTLKFFDLSYGALITVGGYGAFFFSRVHHVPPFIGALFAVFFSGLLGLLIFRIVYTPLRNRGASATALFVTGLGVAMILQGIIAILFTSQFTFLTQGSAVHRALNILGGVVTELQLMVVLLSIVLTFSVLTITRWTRFGYALRAIEENDAAASVLGIPLASIINIVVVLASVIGGIAGVSVGWDTGIEPTMGLPLFFKGIIAAILGGTGNILGGFVGAIVLASVENLGIWGIASEWKDAIAFALLLICLLFRPRGLLGRA